MKTKWQKETPTVEGWYWIKWGRGKKTQTCPAYLTIIRGNMEANMVKAGEKTFIEGPRHGGWGSGMLWDKTLRFGPKLEIPC